MRTFSGASLRRVIDRSCVEITEHAHDWPLLSLFVMGSYINETEIGRESIAAPSAVFYRAGAAHRNTIGTLGFEQIEVEFDPAWLGIELPSAAPVLRWIGGPAAAQARCLVRACDAALSEERLRTALRQFFEITIDRSERESPEWVGTIVQRVREDTTLKVSDLAAIVGRHPSWIGAAYRRATGEGLPDTAARFRVERAARLLRETDQPLASIAIEAGFCDQSHMNRTFRRMLGRSPSATRQERSAFRQRPK